MYQGILFGLLSGVFWGLDGFLLGTVLANEFFTLLPAFYFAPLIAAATHDGFAGMWLLLFNLSRGTIGEYYRVLRKWRTASVIIATAFVGGPFAMSCYLISIYFCGVCYASIVTSTYPVIGALLSACFLRENITKRVWLGIFCTVVGVSVLNLDPTATGQTYENFRIGIVFALLSAIGWALEGVISTAIMRDAIAPEIVLGWREIFSFILYSNIIVYLINQQDFSGIVVDQSIILSLAGIAFVGAVSYLFWYRAMHYLGTSRAMTLNITYAVWAVLFSIIFANTELVPTMLLGGILVLVGSALVILEKRLS